MSNSPLVSYTKLSPHYWKGRRNITRITPHCVVGQCTVETLGAVFSGSRKASSNYGIGKDGKIALFVDESNSAQTSSSYDNDSQAITIEVASDTTAPYAFRDAAYKALINLCVDICRRHGKKKLLWLGSKSAALSYKPKDDEMVLTLHRWFSAKSCPGDWAVSKMPDLAKRVSDQLKAEHTKEEQHEKPTSKVIKCTGVAKKRNASYTGSYVTTDDLNIRNDAGVKNAIIGMIPKGGKCHCYGYYSTVGFTKWYYITYTVNGVQYLGFVNSSYLKKV